jgi:phosphoribosylglycinamide formyltransferase-1
MAIMISGTGSNMDAIISATRRGLLAARAVLVISDKPDAPGLKKART